MLSMFFDMLVAGLYTLEMMSILSKSVKNS